MPSAIPADSGRDIGLQGRLSLVMAPNAPWTILGGNLLKVKFEHKYRPILNFVMDVSIEFIFFCIEKSIKFKDAA